MRDVVSKLGVLSLKSLAKQLAVLIARILALPAACVAAFGRWPTGYLFCAQAISTVPGIPGSYLRVAYYAWTLDGVGRDSQIGFGSYFAHSSASFGDDVGVGAYCVLGQVDIGSGTELASHVQIVSGSKQHRRDEQGRLTDEGRSFRRIKVGAYCWIGAGAIVMADLGDSVTVGAGAVVSRDVADGLTVTGNPAMPKV